MAPSYNMTWNQRTACFQQAPCSRRQENTRIVPMPRSRLLPLLWPTILELHTAVADGYKISQHRPCQKHRALQVGGGGGDKTPQKTTTRVGG